MSDPRAWIASLRGARPHDDDDAHLEPAVVAAWHTVVAAHPEIRVPAEVWFRYVGARLRDGTPGEELARRNLADLYLACGCDAGDLAALHSFEHTVLPAVSRRLQCSADQRADVMQILRERMLVAGAGGCGIANYDGRAPLVIWLRVIASQIGLRQSDRARQSRARDDRQLDQIAPGVPDPALLYFKQHYGAQFRIAFAEAVASMPPRDRNLLRLAVIDELNIDQIAGIYHVHRATAARRLNQARATLVAATRDRMRAALGISAVELESILRGILSMADITLRQVLARGRGGGEID